jgi:hypothetical protein
MMLYKTANKESSQKLYVSSDNLFFNFKMLLETSTKITKQVSKASMLELWTNLRETTLTKK